MKQAATVVSVLFHPLLLPTMLFSMLYLQLPFAKHTGWPYVLLTIFLTTCLVPILSITTFRMTNSISSMAIPNRQERIKPMTFVSLMYGLVWYLFFDRLQINELYPVIIGAIALVLALVTAITLVWKISAHAAGMGGGMGFMLALNYIFPGGWLFYPLLLIVVLAGLVMASRLYLNAHTPTQILAGALLGFAVCFGAVMLFL